ncbi:MAG: hypothetical protein ABSC25_05145 [Roseiarcus sp.]|jgi:hypothetical protein
MAHHSVPLYRIAITRSGDKGDVSNIGIIAFSPELYRVLKKTVTPQVVKDYFKDLVRGDVTIYPMDNIEALQVVMRQALGGGATKTLRFDQTGKSMSALIQSLEIPLEDSEMGLVPNRPPFET